MNLREKLTVIEHDASLNQLRALLRNGASDEALSVQSVSLGQQAKELLGLTPSKPAATKKQK
jgi:hypothetical protein